MWKGSTPRTPIASAPARWRRRNRAAAAARRRSAGWRGTTSSSTSCADSWRGTASPLNRGGGRMADAGFVHAPAGVLPTWWTTAPIDAPVLTAWAGGRRAEALVQRGTDAIAEAAVRSLAALLGVRVATVERQLDG